MVTNLMWPEWVLRPAAVTPLHHTGMTSSGGRSPTGSEQVVGNSPGRNRIVFRGVSVRTAEQERIWRTIAANLGGRGGVIMVPALARRTAPWPVIGNAAQRSLMRVPLTDDILFSDGSNLFTPMIEAVAETAVASGGIALKIRLKRGRSLQIGQIFQAGESAYTISRIVRAVQHGSDTVFDVQFRLPARGAIAAGAALEFDNPRFRARLESDDAMQIDLDMLRFGSGAVAFVEDV